MGGATRSDRRASRVLSRRSITLIQIYLAHPLSAPTREGIEANRKKAAEWAAWLWKQGFSVECSWIVCTSVLEETPENRALGLKSDCEQVRRCDVMVLCGPRISSGMLLEASVAKVIIDFTYIRMDLPHDIGWRHGQPITFEELQKRVAAEAEHAAQVGRAYAAELAETGGG